MTEFLVNEEMEKEKRNRMKSYSEMNSKHNWEIKAMITSTLMITWPLSASSFRQLSNISPPMTPNYSYLKSIRPLTKCIKWGRRGRGQ